MFIGRERELASLKEFYDKDDIKVKNKSQNKKKLLIMWCVGI